MCVFLSFLRPWAQLLVCSLPSKLSLYHRSLLFTIEFYSLPSKFALYKVFSLPLKFALYYRSLLFTTEVCSLPSKFPLYHWVCSLPSMFALYQWSLLFTTESVLFVIEVCSLPVKSRKRSASNSSFCNMFQPRSSRHGERMLATNCSTWGSVFATLKFGLEQTRQDLEWNTAVRLIFTYFFLFLF